MVDSISTSNVSRLSQGWCCWVPALRIHMPPPAVSDDDWEVKLLEEVNALARLWLALPRRERQPFR